MQIYVIHVNLIVYPIFSTLDLKSGGHLEPLFSEKLLNLYNKHNKSSLYSQQTQAFFLKNNFTNESWATVFGVPTKWDSN